MTEPRPLCAEASLGRGEPLAATASRVEHWLLVEYGGYWPYDPLDAVIFAGSLREYLAHQLARLRCARLVLVKRHGRERGDRVRVFYGVTRERDRRFFTLELDGHPDLLDLDVAAALLGNAEQPGTPLEQPLLLVCTHGVRDRCCARYGQALFRAARARERAWTWQASHVGGDRFAGNVVALPEGLYFGRVGADAFPTLLDEYLAGRIALEWYRGASCYPMRLQAAEIAVRRATGLTGLDDLRFAGREGNRVRFRAEVAGDVYEVETAEDVAGEEAFLTCRGRRPRRARQFLAGPPALVS
ncbi:MAG: hypothetical protein ICV64_05325 [Thermoleophilia bacterium]|nr:hypothetical protein [Thermoleophilia bacterium]